MKIDVNGSFEQGWTDLPPAPGNLINQQPTRWTLNILPIGAELWGSQDVVNGIPECVHKTLETLPPNEHPGGSDPLILDGEATYKIFHFSASFGAELTQTLNGLQPGSEARIRVPIRCHRPGSEGDDYAAEFQLLTNGQGGWWNGSKMPHRQWAYREQMRTIGEDGRLSIVIRVKSKWNKSVDFFIDAIEVDAVPADVDPPNPPDPPPDGDLEERIEDLEAENGRQQAEINDLKLRVGALENANPNPPPVLETPFLAVDLSGHNNLASSEWDKLKAGGCQLAIIRSSNGIRKSSSANDTVNAKGEDKLFWSHMSNARARGMRTAVYHFYHKDWGSEQIDHWKAILKEALASGFKIEFIALDFENTSPEAEALIRAGCEAMRDRCAEWVPLRRQKIYTGDWWWNPRVNKGSQWPKQFGVWAGAYVSDQPIDTPPEPSKTWRTPHSWQQKDVWQFTSQGGAIFGLNRNLDVNWVFSLETGKPPGGGIVIDVLPYLMGKHRQQYDKEYRFADGTTGTQTTMIEHLSPVEWLYVKGNNGEYEHFWVEQFQGEDWIFRADDTSESPTRMYAHYLHQGGPLGAPWVPVQMEVSKVYGTTKYVQHYLKDGCVPQNGGPVVNELRLNSIPYFRTYESGVVANVITIEWLNGGEQYDFGGGNLGFRDATRDFWLMGFLQGREPLNYVKYPCMGW